jgi:holo-[acyl-carrier protein] synthase
VLGQAAWSIVENGRRAEKEAAYKALHPHRKTTWKDVEIVKTKQTGTRPLLQWTEASGTDSTVKMHLSVSHDGDYVASTVIAERISPT